MRNEVVFPDNLSWSRRICTFLEFGELKSAALCALDVFLFGALLRVTVHINQFGCVLRRLFGCLAIGIHFVAHSSKYEWNDNNLSVKTNSPRSYRVVYAFPPLILIGESCKPFLFLIAYVFHGQTAWSGQLDSHQEIEQKLTNNKVLCSLDAYYCILWRKDMKNESFEDYFWAIIAN